MTWLTRKGMMGGVGNFAVFDPAISSNDINISGNGLYLTGTAGIWRSAFATFPKATGKFCFEFIIRHVDPSYGSAAMVGVANSVETKLDSFLRYAPNGAWYDAGRFYYSNGFYRTVPSCTPGDITTVAVDIAAQTYKGYCNGVLEIDTTWDDAFTESIPAYIGCAVLGVSEVEFFTGPDLTYPVSGYTDGWPE